MRKIRQHPRYKHAQAYVFVETNYVLCKHCTALNRGKNPACAFIHFSTMLFFSLIMFRAETGQLISFVASWSRGNFHLSKWSLTILLTEVALESG
jgi:hypothetical protein